MAFLARARVQQALLFAVVFVILLSTMAPTFYNFDSVELTIGSAELALVHSPGYPVFLVLGHLFTWIPVGDIGFRVNLVSALSLALTAPILWSALSHLTGNRLIALTSTLLFVWSYYIWQHGVVAEIYAPQLCTLALCAAQLAWLYSARPTGRTPALILGGLFGFAVATHPSSVLFAPGLILAYRGLRISWRTSFLAGLIAILVFGCSLLYFPIQADRPHALNLAGEYNAKGVFEAVDLQTARGVWWLISGRQFDSLFFENGFLPTFKQVSDTCVWLWGNYLSVGVVLGLAGLVAMARKERGMLIVWLVCFVPYTYFFTTYGAPDRDTMMGPSYLLWTVPLSFGLRWLVAQFALQKHVHLLLVLPVLALFINYPLVDLSDDTSVRVRSERLIQALPQDAIVLGVWWDIVPLQYLQIIEDQRPDVTLFNLFLFKKKNLRPYLDVRLRSSDRPVVFLGSYGESYIDERRYRLVLLWNDFEEARLQDVDTGIFQVEYSSSNYPLDPVSP